ncbi:hypothetical protein [Paenibacillus nasutitermitis]|uniref:hypothetical protein n=1 Tax=Paenibacillus nasutitermitis TaxID=1652958 RepID=UPI00166750DD|nr:hypothetical protein [Paenibacillus nasutitermitis]
MNEFVALPILWSGPIGIWTHLVLTGDRNGTSLYVNGNQYVERLEGQTLETFVLRRSLLILTGQTRVRRGLKNKAYLLKRRK